MCRACCQARRAGPSPDVSPLARHFYSNHVTRSPSRNVSSSHRQAVARSEATTTSQWCLPCDTLPSHPRVSSRSRAPQSQSCGSYQLCAPRHRACNRNDRTVPVIHLLLPKPSDPCAACFRSARSPLPCRHQLPSRRTALPLAQPFAPSANDAHQRWSSNAQSNDLASRAKVQARPFPRSTPSTRWGRRFQCAVVPGWDRSYPPESFCRSAVAAVATALRHSVRRDAFGGLSVILS